MKKYFFPKGLKQVQKKLRLFFIFSCKKMHQNKCEKMFLAFGSKVSVRMVSKNCLTQWLKVQEKLFRKDFKIRKLLDLSL